MRWFGDIFRHVSQANWYGSAPDDGAFPSDSWTNKVLDNSSMEHGKEKHVQSFFFRISRVIDSTNKKKKTFGTLRIQTLVFIFQYIYIVPNAIIYINIHVYKLTCIAINGIHRARRFSLQRRWIYYSARPDIKKLPTPVPLTVACCTRNDKFISI